MKSFRELPVEDRLSAEKRYEILRQEIEELQEALKPAKKTKSKSKE